MFKKWIGYWGRGRGVFRRGGVGWVGLDQEGLSGVRRD